MKRVFRWIWKWVLTLSGIRKGYPWYYALRIQAQFFYEYMRADWKVKKQIYWAHKKGFSYDKAILYGINEQNYKDYLNDCDYYRLYPINGDYSEWINDKLTFMYFVREFKEYLPACYFHLDYHGRIFYLPDYDRKTRKECVDVEEILTFLEKKKNLVAKPLDGTSSVGYHLLKYNDGIYLDNETPICREKLADWIKNSAPYIIQEYIAFSKGVPEYAESIRIILIHPNGCLPQIVCAYLSQDISKDKDESYYSCILSNIDIETGEFIESRKINFHKDIHSLKKNPRINNATDAITYKERTTGKVPHWNEISNKILEIAEYYPHLIYIGIDIIVTEESFKILEFNSHQDPINQIFLPYLKDGTFTAGFFQQQLEELRKKKRGWNR